MKHLNECSAVLQENRIPYSIEVPEQIFPERDLIIATALGNGLTDFGIQDLDTLFFSTSTTAKIGDVVMVGWDGGDPIVRQLLVDIDSGNYILHASGAEMREDVYTPAPEIYGVLAYVLKRCPWFIGEGQPFSKQMM